MTDDEGGGGGAVAVWRRRTADDVVGLGDRAAKFGVAGVDRRVDDRHQHPIAGGQLVRLGELQFRLGVGPCLPRRWAGRVLQHEQLVRLGRENLRVSLQLAHRGVRGAAGRLDQDPGAGRQVGDQQVDAPQMVSDSRARPPRPAATTRPPRQSPRPQYRCERPGRAGARPGRTAPRPRSSLCRPLCRAAPRRRGRGRGPFCPSGPGRSRAPAAASCPPSCRQEASRRWQAAWRWTAAHRSGRRRSGTPSSSAGSAAPAGKPISKIKPEQARARASARGDRSAILISPKAQP